MFHIPLQNSRISSMISNNITASLSQGQMAGALSSQDLGQEVGATSSSLLTDSRNEINPSGIAQSMSEVLPRRQNEEAALARVLRISINDVKKIAEIFRRRYGREALKADIIEMADSVKNGELTLPPNSDSDNNSDLSDAQSNSEFSESEDDSLSIGDSEGYDEVDGSETEPVLSHVAPSSQDQRNSGIGNSGVRDINVEADSVPHEQARSQNQNDEVDGLESPTSPEERKQWMIQHSLLVLQKEYEILDASRKCVECKLTARDTTFLPCGHFMMCKDCSEPVYTCPSCSKSIQATAQTYLS